AEPAAVRLDRPADQQRVVRAAEAEVGAVVVADRAERDAAAGRAERDVTAGARLQVGEVGIAATEGRAAGERSRQERERAESWTAGGGVHGEAGAPRRGYRRPAADSPARSGAGDQRGTGGRPVRKDPRRAAAISDRCARATRATRIFERPVRRARSTAGSSS